jgi:hypothetical protein
MTEGDTMLQIGHQHICWVPKVLVYRCTPNIGTIISAENSKLLQQPKPEKRMCNWKDSQACPVNGKYLDSGIIVTAQLNLNWSYS